MQSTARAEAHEQTELERAAASLVKDWPPLTPKQCDIVRVLLGSK